MDSLDRIPHPDYFVTPKDHIVGFFDNRGSVEKVVRELQQHGVQDEYLNLFEGDEGLHAIDIDGSEHSMIEYYARKAQKFFGSGDWQLIEEADNELRKGHFLLSVLITGDEMKQQVLDSFRKNGVHGIRHVHSSYVEEIST